MGERVPYLVATSTMAHLPGRRRYHPIDTIEYAESVGAEGVQLHTSQAHLVDPIKVRDELGRSGLTHNIVHLDVGSVLTSRSFGENGRRLLRTASRMVDPLPGIERVICVIHHDGASQESPKQIAHMTKRVLSQVGDQPITLGFECTPLGNDGPLAVQVGRYLDVYTRLAANGLPVIPVVDARNLNDVTQGRRFYDEGNQLLGEICEVAAGGPAIVHARDVRHIDAYDSPGNAVVLGKGKFAPVYQELSRLGNKNDIKWLALVDENQEPVLRRRPDIDESLVRLGFAQTKADSEVLVG